MNYIFEYNAPHPFDTIQFACDENALIGLWFGGQSHFSSIPKRETMISGKHLEDFPAAVSVRDWLDCYFSGSIPTEFPPISLKGTPFQESVWKILREIPYGTVITYQKIAEQIAAERGLKRMSAQAVGGAVGSNPISIIVPCHRVVGTNGNLTGYDGGIKYKIWLLEHEGMDVSRFSMPKVRGKRNPSTPY